MSRSMDRRSFLTNCFSAAAALSGSQLTHLGFSSPKTPFVNSRQILVVIFLRGGWDALNVIPPIAGADRGYYQAARPNLTVPTSGSGAAINLDGQFGMHPAFAPLLPLYQARKLAFITAAGLDYDTRSHFDAQKFIELGTPGGTIANDGWLTRHFQTSPHLVSGMIFPALSAGGGQAMSLLGMNEAVSMSSPSAFQLNGHWSYESLQRAALRDLYNGSSWLEVAGTETLDIIDLIESTNPGNYVPAGNAAYPNNSFGDNLQSIAQLIKMQLGLHIATVDLGGWDTHENQGDDGAGYFSTSLLAPLGQGLAAFYTDLAASCGNFHQRTTVIVMSEFGRRLKENANHGTDHGHGSVMLALGGAVKGGKVYGDFPGLHNDQLYQGADLAVTTDYRRVLSEILVRQLGNPNINEVFPGYTDFSPLNFLEDAYPVIPEGLDQKTYLPFIGDGVNNGLCP